MKTTTTTSTTSTVTTNAIPGAGGLKCTFEPFYRGCFSGRAGSFKSRLNTFFGSAKVRKPKSRFETFTIVISISSLSCPLCGGWRRACRPSPPRTRTI
eukprot:2890181-Pyramimonas_sp.AAC.1